MLAFLTDAHISPDVAAQIQARRPEVVIHTLREWQGGALLQEEDDVILAAAWEERLTLVTYDQRTIAPLITLWAAEGRDHAGVIFISRRTIAQSDRGSQIRGLLALWEAKHTEEWVNLVDYLKPEP